MFSRTVIDANNAATWKVRPTPIRAIARGGKPSIRAPINVTVPAVRPQLAVDEIEARRFAGPVRSDQRDELPGPHIERDIANGIDAAEGFRQAFDGQYGVIRHRLRLPPLRLLPSALEDQSPAPRLRTRREATILPSTNFW